MSLKAQLQTLHALREEMKAEIEGLQQQLRGVEKSIERLQQQEPDGAQTPVTAKTPRRKQARRPKRGNVKAMLLELLQEVGQTGLNAPSAVEMALQRGLALDRATVSSLLSRFKRDGIVEHTGDKYRLPAAPVDGLAASERQRPSLHLAKAS